MTPPRGDNWAGALGMTVAALVFFLRHRLVAVAYALLVAGFVGGCGFVGATFLKLAEVKYVPLTLSRLFGDSAWQTNWHSVLEQTYGVFNGIGIGMVMFALARRLPAAADRPRTRRWTEVVAVAFVLLAVTYVNLVKDVGTWVQFHAVQARLHGLPPRVWFDLGYALLAVAVTGLLVRHLRCRLAVVPESPLGQGQLLYVVFLWWVVIGKTAHSHGCVVPTGLALAGRLDGYRIADQAESGPARGTAGGPFEQQQGQREPQRACEQEEPGVTGHASVWHVQPHKFSGNDVPRLIGREGR
jgi:hypothetical protein